MEKSNMPGSPQKHGRQAIYTLITLAMAAFAIFALAFSSSSAGASALLAPKGDETVTATAEASTTALDTETPTPIATDTALPTATATSEPTESPTRRPIKLRPRVQFGYAAPDHNQAYRLVMFNHLTEQTNVNMQADSLFNWGIEVTPTVALALPNYANIIGAVVHVPSNPIIPVDVERVRGTTDTDNPYSTTAYLITVTHRHPWSDVGATDWADGPIQYLYSKNVIAGYADGSFRPGDLVTRAQFAKMLVGAMGWTLVTPQTPTFSDVPADFWGYSYIETAYSHGAITGYADGTFRPGADVTRAQVAKMVYIGMNWSLDSGAETLQFNDVQPGNWYYTYAMAAGSSEIMTGYSDNTFRPNEAATRAQVAKILSTALFSDPNF